MARADGAERPNQKRRTRKDLLTAAARLMKQLDSGGGYRSQIERDLAKRLGEGTEKAERVSHVCGSCSTSTDPDARFCKNCGKQL